jgi:hypothetical protein
VGGEEGKGGRWGEERGVAVLNLFFAVALFFSVWVPLRNFRELPRSSLSSRGNIIP